MAEKKKGICPACGSTEKINPRTGKLQRHVRLWLSFSGGGFTESRCKGSGRPPKVQ